MTLDEIISNAEYCADVYEKMNKAIHPALQVSDYKRHAEDHRQLAGWLKDYKRLKEQEPCDDAISRQSVLDEAFEVDTKEYGRIDVVGADAINALPPVTPQQKKGQWIRVDKDKLRCSECEVIHLIAQYPNGKINWCPNCGAKMEGAEENG